jgi:hypothetical protein
MPGYVVRRADLSDISDAIHDDGTITVAPSILANPQPDDPEPGSGESWHGFLEAGIWREV